MFWLNINRTSNTSLIRQIYLELRKRILAGELKARERLPPSREFAAHLGVSRNVVLEAYEQLHSEGYLETRQGSGTYVAQGAAWTLVNNSNRDFVDAPRENATTPKTNLIDFRYGVPSLEHFPRKLWARITKEVIAETPSFMFGYGMPEGCVELRCVLSQYLLKTRGVNCKPEQIVITNGASQAFTLVAKLFVKSGDTVVVEDPVTREIRDIYGDLGVELYPVPVDERGLITHLLPSHLNPSFILVTPSHQFPLGSVLTIQRRIELLEFARAKDCFIVEDDYDSEFRYEGTPVSSLQGLDCERVIYIGTFSKIISPALRIGYVVLPSHLVERLRYLKRLADLHTSYFEQLVLAHFIDFGHLEHHIARMRKLYQKRRNALRNSLISRFANQVEISGDSTGMHLVASFTGINFCEQALLKNLETQGIKIYPVAAHSLFETQHQEKIILGYGNLGISEIETGIERLQQVLI